MTKRFLAVCAAAACSCATTDDVCVRPLVESYDYEDPICGLTFIDELESFNCGQEDLDAILCVLPSGMYYYYLVWDLEDPRHCWYSAEGDYMAFRKLDGCGYGYLPEAIGREYPRALDACAEVHYYPSSLAPVPWPECN